MNALSPQAAAALVGSTALSPASRPSAPTLEQIGAEYVALEAEHCRICPLDDSPDPKVQKATRRRLMKIHARHRVLFKMVTDMPARTPAELRARPLLR